MDSMGEHCCHSEKHGHYRHGYADALLALDLRTFFGFFKLTRLHSTVLHVLTDPWLGSTHEASFRPAPEASHSFDCRRSQPLNSGRLRTFPLLRSPSTPAVRV